MGKAEDYRYFSLKYSESTSTHISGDLIFVTLFHFVEEKKCPDRRISSLLGTSITPATSYKLMLGCYPSSRKEK